MREIVLIVAMDKNRCIGKNNRLPWDLPGDRKRFAIATEGGTVVMGRKTHESIIAALGKPLPRRRNIVFTRQKDVSSAFPNVIFVSSWDEMLQRAGGAEEIFVIGGEEIYRLALPYADRVIITHVDAVVLGDAFFPELDEREWRRVYSDKEGPHKEHAEDEHPYHISWYWKQKKPATVDMDNARLPEQRRAMEEIIARGHCPFCPGNLPPEHKQPIEKDGAHWFVTKNQWPHKNAKLDLLFILKRHAETLKELTQDEGGELFRLLSWAESHFAFPGGGILMRFGDTNFSTATVRHLHAHLFVPDRENPNYEPVRFKIGKDRS